jgi:hypothetical protein
MLILVSSASAGEEPTFSEKDTEKLSELVNELFKARIVDERKKEIEVKEELSAFVKELEKKNSIDDLLRHTDLWYQIRESTIQKDGPLIKKKGRGFQKVEFIDNMDVTETMYEYYVNIPKDYSHEGDTRYPVIIFLHPEITGKNKKIDREVQNMLKGIYKDKEIQSNYIIIAPLGPMVGKKKKKKLVDAAKDWEDNEYGRKTAFVAIRILLEQLVFDRSKVILDGIGKAGLSAYRFATWYPSYFSGVIGRDVSLEPLAMENVKNIPFLYLSSSENNKSDEAKKWAENHSEGEIPQVSFIEDEGKLIKPSDEAIGAVKEWMSKVTKDTIPNEVYLKTASMEFASSHWIKIKNLNAGLDLTDNFDDPNYPWIKAVVDKESNSIVLDTKRIIGFTVYLNDQIVDLDKTVTIVLNGNKRFEGKIERSLDKMLDKIFYDPDFEIYVNYKDLTVEE